MARLTMYRTYRFIDKDPIIDKVRTLLKEEKLIGKLGVVHELSGVSTSTLDNWFNGDTMSPQNRTVAAVITSLGYEMTFVKEKTIDLDRELKAAARWYEQQNNTVKKPPKTRRSIRKASPRLPEHRSRA